MEILGGDGACGTLNGIRLRAPDAGEQAGKLMFDNGRMVYCGGGI